MGLLAFVGNLPIHTILSNLEIGTCHPVIVEFSFILRPLRKGAARNASADPATPDPGAAPAPPDTPTLPPWLVELSEPRLAGVREQVARARKHVEEALANEDPQTRYRKVVAAIYPGRAAVEIMREAAEHGELSVSKADLDAQLAPLLPRCELVEAMRIHDYHRFGLTPKPDAVVVLGPIRLRVAGGSAQIQYAPGAIVAKEGNANVTGSVGAARADGVDGRGWARRSIEFNGLRKGLGAADCMSEI